MLDSFEIDGFRTFRHLRIDRLGDVNLIVGKNNTGKSSLLEALRVYAVNGHVAVLREILARRDEVTVATPSRGDEVEAFALFHGRQDSPYVTEIHLGEIDSSDKSLRIDPVLLREVRSPDRDVFESPQWQLVSPESAMGDPDLRRGLRVTRGEEQRVIEMESFARRSALKSRIVGPTFIPATGADDTEVGLWWDRITLSDAEARVIECLNLVAPVERVSLVEYPSGRHRNRMFMVRLKGARVAVPLKSFGDGMTRMFQIALALECSRRPRGDQPSLFPENLTFSPEIHPFLLIDEVENGIHYTLMAQYWEFIFRVARLHGVQVFATSHSWDCVEGFQIAASRETLSTAMLVRLELSQQTSKAVLFDKDELQIVSREQIEVR